jgi:L-malate glycosyltransferase
MKIGLCILSLPMGGAETVVYNLQKYFSSKGHSVTIFANREFFNWDPPLSCDIVDLGPLLDVNNLAQNIFGGTFKIPNFLVKKKYFYYLPLLDIYFKKNIDLIYQKIMDKRIDILHFHDPSTLKLFKYLPKDNSMSFAYTFHGDDLKLPFYVRENKRNFIKLINSMDLITTVSNYMKGNLLSDGIKNDIKVIYNGVNFDRINYLKNFYHDNEGIKLIFPGGMKPNKGGKILLEAYINVIKIKPRLLLYYCGSVDDNFKKEYLNSSIIFTGQLNNFDYLDLLAKTDIFVLLSKMEAFPISIVEAMSLGNSIITTNVGGISEICINNKNGIFVERNSEDVFKKIIYLTENIDARKILKINNLEDSKKFDWDNIANQYLDMYGNVI